MFKEVIISVGLLLSLVSSIYLVKCGAKTPHTYIDVEPIEIENTID